MLTHLSQRLLSLLQLTRMALVFTAIADGLCTVLLSAQLPSGRCGLSRTRYSWCSILPRKSPRQLSGGTIRRCQPPGPRAPEAPCRECLRRARHAGK